MAQVQDLVFGLDQLERLGLSASAVRKRAAAGRLYRVHRAVYALVPLSQLTVRARYRAALLACRGRAGDHVVALSHRSAADLHGLRACHRQAVEVIVAGTTAHRHERIDLHRSTTLTADDITTIDGIAVTTVARTSLDLAAVVAARQVELALNQAEVLGVFDLAAVNAQLERNPATPGTTTLRAVLGDFRAGMSVTRSQFEERFRAVWRSSAPGSRVPEFNAFVDPADGEPGFRPDVIWRDAKLAVELDGAPFHLTRRSFEEDRRRDQRLIGAGWRVIRVTWRQLEAEPGRIIALILGQLGLEPTRG